jgi:hypothetical protein
MPRTLYFQARDEEQRSNLKVASHPCSKLRWLELIIRVPDRIQVYPWH